jgi:hypothetical protein
LDKNAALFFQKQEGDSTEPGLITLLSLFDRGIVRSYVTALIRNVQGSGLNFTYSEAMNLELDDLVWYVNKQHDLVSSEHKKYEDPEEE